MNSADGSLLELSALRLDPLDLLDPPRTSSLLLFESVLPLLCDWLIFSEWGILLIAVLLPCSPLALPPLDLTLLAFPFFDLPSLLSEDFACCCGCVLLGWGGVIGGCGWTVGGFILGAAAVGLFCGVWLSMTTCFRLSSSVCSLAKLTKTYKNETLILTVCHFSNYNFLV